MQPHERQTPPGRAGFESRSVERPAGHPQSTRAVVDLPPAALNRRRRRLPYQQEVEQAIAEGRTPNVFLFAGPDAWNLASRRRFRHGRGCALVLPGDLGADAVAWPAMLDGFCLVAPSLTRQQALEIAQAAVTGGVRLVVALGHDFLVRRPA